MRFFQLSLSKIVKSYILDTSNPIIAWKILENIYSTKRIVDMMRILGKWENIKIIKNMIVSVFVQYIYNLLNYLKEINELPKEIVIVHKIFKNLLKKYEIFVRIL